jgi:hypothetical protein
VSYRPRSGGGLSSGYQADSGRRGPLAGWATTLRLARGYRGAGRKIGHEISIYACPCGRSVRPRSVPRRRSTPAFRAACRPHWTNRLRRQRQRSTVHRRRGVPPGADKHDREYRPTDGDGEIRSMERPAGAADRRRSGVLRVCDTLFRIGAGCRDVEGHSVKWRMDGSVPEAPRAWVRSSEPSSILHWRIRLRARQDGVTGRPLFYVARVVAPQGDGVVDGVRPEACPMHHRGRPWSIMPEPTSCWN